MASNASKADGYDCKFVETPPDKLICQICHFVAYIPHKVTCCGRIYCKACLDKHEKHYSTCPNCRKTSFKESHSTKREQEIKALKVKCNNSERKCDWVGELRSLDDHHKTCGYALIHCKNECTVNNKVVHVLRRDLHDHLKDKCPNREHPCPHCKAIGRYCDITTTHLDTCPKLEVPCPNIGCDVEVPRCDLSNHQSTCQFEKVPCTYAEIGCEEEPLRKDMEQHENDAAVHLHLAIKTVNELQKKMKHMGDNVATCPCVFKMPEYHKHKSLKQEWCSPPCSQIVKASQRIRFPIQPTDCDADQNCQYT